MVASQSSHGERRGKQFSTRFPSTQVDVILVDYTQISTSKIKMVVKMIYNKIYNKGPPVQLHACCYMYCNNILLFCHALLVLCDRIRGL